jgi:protein tyrosine/serine phosphatase
MKNKIIFLALVFVAVLGAGCAKNYKSLSGEVLSVNPKYGNVILSITSGDLSAAGYEVGDLLDVTFSGGQGGSMPVMDSFTAKRGQEIIMLNMDGEFIGAAIQNGNLSEKLQIKAGEGVTLAMNKKGGYKNEIDLRSLVRSNERAAYESDAVFANFREVTGGDIASGILYRGSHPILSDWTRAPYAASLMQNAGIATIINMSDSEIELQILLEETEIFSHENYSTYYANLHNRGDVIALGMGLNMNAPAFSEGIIRACRFIMEHDAPYYMHCNEGKDRTGFFAALLEAFMGAELEQIEEDYMLSYVNYYGFIAGSEKYKLIAQENFIPILKIIAGTDDINAINLQSAATSYLERNGLSGDEIERLRAVLANNK